MGIAMSREEFTNLKKNADKRENYMFISANKIVDGNWGGESVCQQSTVVNATRKIKPISKGQTPPR